MRRETLRGMFFGVIGLLLLGCGHRWELNVSALEAQRQTDNHVTATMTVSCLEVGPDKDCPAAYCLQVQWFDASATNAGQKLDQVTDCNVAPISGPRDLSNGQSAVFAVASGQVLPETPLRIVADVVFAETSQANPRGDVEIVLP